MLVERILPSIRSAPYFRKSLINWSMLEVLTFASESE